MGVLHKQAMVRKSKSGGSVTEIEEEEEQIYWLRPALAANQQSPDGSGYFCWFKKRPKHKVTFDDSTSTSVNR
ncbi:unnamed protein product [Acanthoscelides obtectus]|nr:unnamed protein product [Acanthoscelides obtectus]CAK1626863.1 hypothetical protein AOBTE_LOCUS4123 [Acanthoscelides obtectus]